MRANIVLIFLDKGSIVLICDYIVIKKNENYSIVFRLGLSLRAMYDTYQLDSR